MHAPLSDDLLTAHTVRPLRLRRKAAVGNEELAVERYEYPELGLEEGIWDNESHCSTPDTYKQFVSSPS